MIVRSPKDPRPKPPPGAKTGPPLEVTLVELPREALSPLERRRRAWPGWRALLTLDFWMATKGRALLTLIALDFLAFLPAAAAFALIAYLTSRCSP